MRKSKSLLRNKAKSLAEVSVREMFLAILDSVAITADDGYPSPVGHDHDDRYYTKAETNLYFYDKSYIESNFAPLSHYHYASDITNFAEAVDDRISVLVENGTGITWSYNDALNKFTPTVSLAPFTTDQLLQGITNLYVNSTEKSNWNDAYSWGNHASSGYLLSSVAASTYQPKHTNLTSLTGLTYATPSFVKMTSAGTFALDTNTYALSSALSGYLPLSGGTMGSGAVVDFGNTGKIILGNSYNFLTGNSAGGYSVMGQNIIAKDGGNLEVYSTTTDGYGAWINSYSYGMVYLAQVGSVTAGTNVDFSNIKFYVDKAGSGYFNNTLLTGNTITAGHTGSGANISAVSSFYGNNGLFNAYGTDNNIKLQMGGLSNTKAFIYTPSTVDLDVYVGATVRLNINDSTGQASFTNAVKIGQGSATPNQYLSINTTSGNTAGLQIFQDGWESWNIYVPSSATPLKFSASGTDVMSLTNLGDLAVVGTLTASSFIKSGGTSSQFLKADGSVDSSTYATASSISGTSGKIAKFVSGSAVGNSIMSEGVGAIGVDGVLYTNNYTTESSGYRLNATTIGYNSAGSYGWITAGGGANRTTLALNGGGGKVLIGTTTDDGVNKLQVNGSIVSCSLGGAIKLTQASSDYAQIQDKNSFSRIWFETTGGNRTLFDLPTGGSFNYRDSLGNVLMSLAESGVLNLKTNLGSTLFTLSNTAATFTTTVQGTRLISTIATGTSPLVVASTTRVDNLNVQYLDGQASSYYYAASNPAGYTTNAGTVTSIAMSVPTGLSISGSPITTSGTLALTLQSGYSIPLDSSQSNWEEAYSWGNHGAAGYAFSSDISGTTGKFAKFTSGGAVGNSIVSESGSVISIAGSLLASYAITSGMGYGFYNTNYQTGFNNIWAFATATGYGIGYKYGSGDKIRFDVSGELSNISLAADFEIGGNAAWINGNTVWHQGNDGAGSGLDADLLDGLHGASYYLATNPSAFITISEVTSLLADSIVYGETSGSGDVDIDDTRWTALNLSTSAGPLSAMAEDSGKLTYYKDGATETIVRVIVSIGSKMAAVISGSFPYWLYAIAINSVVVNSSIQPFKTDGEMQNCGLSCLVSINDGDVVSVMSKAILTPSSATIGIGYFNMSIQKAE